VGESAEGVVECVDGPVGGVGVGCVDAPVGVVDEFIDELVE